MSDDQELDTLILSLAQPKWRKKAMIIARALHHLEAPSSDDVADTVADRIDRLVEMKRLEGRGDLSRWRFSEVRLPTFSG